MMALVDTSVWIELFADRPFPQVKILDSLVDEKADICICGIILTEVLQGIRREREYKKTKELFDNLIFLPMTHPTFIRSAEIYRSLRRRGITIRRSMDCLIASVAIEHDITLLHNDKDFLPIEKHFGLKSFKLKKGGSPPFH